MTLVGDHRRRLMPRLTAASAPVRQVRGRLISPVVIQADDDRLWDYYRTLGVVHYAMQFKRDAALRARILPAELGAPGNDPEPTEDPGARAVFDELDAGRGRLAEAVGDLIVHLDVTGVGWPVYQVRGVSGGVIEDRLTVYGTREVKRLEGGRLALTNADGATRSDPWTINTEGSPPDLVATVWRSSPEAHSVPDSPLRSVAEECEQLIAIGRMVRATAWSRTAAGILIVSDEMTLPPAPDQPEAPDPFLQDLVAALSAPISDPGSAAAVAPYVLYGPTEAAQATRHLDMGRRITRDDLDLRLELRVAVVTGLDLPNEVATGLATANHWSAWLIDASAYRQHIDPPLLLGLEGLSRYIYQPMLMRRLNWSQEQAERFVLWRDITQLTASPNRVADAVLLFDRGIIGAAPVRRVAGYDETDKPEGDEASGPSLEEDEEGDEGEPERQVEPGTPPEADGPQAAAAALRAAAGPVRATALADLDGGLLTRLLAASRDAQRRALDRAGARARNRLRRSEDLSAIVADVPNREVTRRLGRQVVTERLQLGEADLVTADDFAEVREDARGWLDRAVLQSAVEAERLGGDAAGRDTAEENDAVDRAVELLVAALLAATVARLFTPGPEPDPAATGEVGDPDGLPAGEVVDVMTVAGGGLAGTLPASTTYDVGVGNGPRTAGWLRQGGMTVVANRWVYGDRAARSHNFLPHLTLDGIEFDRWDDPALMTLGTFPRGGRYYPQDHRGCLCRYEKALWRP